MRSGLVVFLTLMLQQCFLVIQSIYLSIERNPVRLYNFGCLDAVGFGLLIVYICLRAQFSTAEYQWSFTTVVVLVIQFLAAVVCCLACLSIPRRPHLQEGGTAVDAQYTVSAFDSYTFRWAGPTFVLARKKKTLGLDDLPKLHWKIRSASLQNYFNSMKMRDQLWKSLVVAHYPELLFQTVFATLQAAVQFIPSLAMYQLLKLLEQRTSGAPVRKAMWGLVIALGLSIIFSAWLQAWTHWIVWARLGSPIRTELSAMIFTKSTRRKDVKDVQKSRASTRLEVANGIFPALQGSDNQQGIETASIPAPSPAQRKQDEENKEPEEDIQKSRQSTINLVVCRLFSVQN